MKNIASLFSEEARAELKAILGIDLSDDHDYTQDELDDLYIRITDDFPYGYAPDGEPLRMGRIFEEIVDTFAKHKLVELNL